MSSRSNWKKKLPMWMTYSRIVITPFIVATFYLKGAWVSWIAATLFILASITDWLDGYWARAYQVESTMGKFMDPIADKLLVLAVLIMLLDMGRVDPLMVLILLSRDLFIGGLRSVSATNSVVIAAKSFGKWKTALQMVAIPFLLVNTSAFGFSSVEIGYWLLWGSVFLSLSSALQYALEYYKGKGRTAP